MVLNGNGKDSVWAVIWSLTLLLVNLLYLFKKKTFHKGYFYIIYFFNTVC